MQNSVIVKDNVLATVDSIALHQSSVVSMAGRSTESSLALTNIERVSSSECEFTVREKLKECFKPRYRVRRVKNKGAILVLVWSFLVTSLFLYLSHVASKMYNNDIVYIIIQTIVGLTMPIGGCLADVRFGRYKVISVSIWTMWLTSMLLTTGIVIGQSVDLKDESYYKMLLTALVVLLALGLGAFQANIIQFGVDQLVDASSSEIMAFVMWYTCTIFSSMSIVGMIVLYTSDEYNKLIVPLLVCIKLTLAVCFNILFKNVLTVEPGTTNPFKLVYKVVRYAIKNKHIRQRTAFSYCENYLPSRIDFGKSKYGGPFTTEQVEDVKTLFRVIVVIFLGCAFSGMISKQISLQKTSSIIFMGAVLRLHKDTFAGYFVGPVLIPIYEFLIYPLFHRCLPKVNAIGKFFIGGLLYFGWYAILLALITYGRMHYNTTSTVNSSSNATLPCLFHGSADFLGDTLNYKSVIVLGLISSVSQQFMLIAVIEFWCAQVPYSMKGLVVGIAYGFITLFVAISRALSLLFKLKSIAWSTGALSCSFWYLLTMLVYMFIVSIGFGMAAKWYKRRKREDVLPSEHIFAEEYYSKYIT